MVAGKRTRHSLKFSTPVEAFLHKFVGLPGFEPGLHESKSCVLTVTL